MLEIAVNKVNKVCFQGGIMKELTDTLQMNVITYIIYLMPISLTEAKFSLDNVKL